MVASVISQQIAQAMVATAEYVFFTGQPSWSAAIGRQKNRTLAIKVGSGKATYFRGGASNDLIVFGRKMVESKMSGEKTDWLSYREIIQRQYFAGDVSLLNVFAHTICHEVAHLMQFYRGGRRYGSVHNQVFYEALDELYQDSNADQVKQHLATLLSVQGIGLDALEIPHKTALAPRRSWAKGQTITFLHEGQRIEATVMRVNSKTVSAKPKNASARLAYWRIPFGLIESS